MTRFVRSIGLALLGVLAAAFLSFTPVAARAATIDFEHSDPVIANGYGGLDWSNFGTHPDYVGGYHTGIVSGSNTAYSFWGEVASIGRQEAFNLYDGYFTSAWRDGMTLQVLGYKDGIQLYDTSWIINSTGPALLSFNYIGVDFVRFITKGGILVVSGGEGDNFVMDDLRVEVTQTPIAGALPLFATALSGLALVVRRKKRQVTS